MSEETTPLLRLKPRVRPDAGSTSPAVQPPAGQPTKKPAEGRTSSASAESEVKEPRLTLKSRIAVSPTPTPPPAAAAIDSVTPAALAEPPLTPAEIPMPVAPENVATQATDSIPAPALDALPAAAIGSPDLNLEIAALHPGPLLSKETPSAAPALLSLETLGEMPLPKPKAPTFKSFPPKPVHIRSNDATRPAEVPRSRTPVRPEHRPAFKFGLVATVVLAFGALTVGGYFAVKTFQDLRPPEKRQVKKAAPVPAVTTNPVTAKTTHPEPGPSTTSANNRLIQAARTVAARNQDEVTAIIDAGQNPAALAPTAPTVSNSSGPSRIDAVEDKRVVHSQPPPLPSESKEFRAYVDSMRVGGVFQGNPARAYINGRTYKAGALLDASLGIVFEGVDANRSELVLRDASGATVRKKY